MMELFLFNMEDTTHISRRFSKKMYSKYEFKHISSQEVQKLDLFSFEIETIKLISQTIFSRVNL